MSEIFSRGLYFAAVVHLAYRSLVSVFLLLEASIYWQRPGIVICDPSRLRVHIFGTMILTASKRRKRYFAYFLHFIIGLAKLRHRFCSPKIVHILIASMTIGTDFQVCNFNMPQRATAIRLIAGLLGRGYWIHFENRLALKFSRPYRFEFYLFLLLSHFI